MKQSFAQWELVVLDNSDKDDTTFLAADDGINNGSLQRLYEIIQQESPNIIWVGNAEVEYQKDGDFKLKNTVIPSYTAYDVHNRSEVIRNLMEEVYYKENINFFEPYYAYCE